MHCTLTSIGTPLLFFIFVYNGKCVIFRSSFLLNTSLLLYNSISPASILCAVLHAHSHLRHPTQTVVSTKTPIYLLKVFLMMPP
jgi:hypothetical protein